MNGLSIANLRDKQTSSGNSLLSVNQQIALGFGIAFGLAILRLFQKLSPEDVHASFQHTFLVMGVITIASAFVFRRLHFRDGDNMKSEE